MSYLALSLDPRTRSDITRTRDLLFPPDRLEVWIDADSALFETVGEGSRWQWSAAMIAGQHEKRHRCPLHRYRPSSASLRGGECRLGDDACNTPRLGNHGQVAGLHVGDMGMGSLRHKRELGWRNGLIIRSDDRP
jgi:hypothetical protein